MPAARAGALRRRRIKVLPAFSKAAVGKAEPYDLALKAKRSFAEKAMQAQARTSPTGARAQGRTVFQKPPVDRPGPCLRAFDPV